MDWRRKSSQWRCPPRDLVHDTMSPKCQTWRRIKCFKVSQAEIKPNRPLGWWTGFVTGKSHRVATMTPRLWRTGATHVSSCSSRRKKKRNESHSLVGYVDIVYLVVLNCQDWECATGFVFTCILEHNHATMTRFNWLFFLNQISIFAIISFFRCFRFQIGLKILPSALCALLPWCSDQG